MANRYCNLIGTNKIKDEWQKINQGFDAVEADMNQKAAAADLTNLQNTVNDHIGAGGNAHAVATDQQAGFMSAQDKQKLDGVEAGAQVNQNAFAKVNDVEAADPSDELTITGGTGITITTNPNTKEVIVTATGSSTPGPHGSAHTEFGADPIPLATTTEGGLMSASDKAKLDGATSAATPNTLVQRDPAGRFKAAAPSASDDVARKADVDAVANNRKLVTYTSLADLGLSSVDFDGLTTEEQFFDTVIPKMADGSQLVLMIYGNNTPINNVGRFLPGTGSFGSVNGILEIVKGNNDRTSVTYNFVTTSALGGAYPATYKGSYAAKNTPPNRRWSGWKPIQLGQEEYDLPLAAGMVNLKTVLSSHDCKIYRVGNLAILVFALTKSSGNFTSGETIATIPSGIRPPVVMTILGRMIYVTNPTNTGGTYLGACEVNVVTNGNVVVYPADLQGNRVMGTVAYTIT